MAEEKTITQQAIGYGFSVSIEREIRTDTGAKYPDKTVVKASLSGHANTFEDAEKMLGDATEKVKEKVDDLEKNKT